MLFALENKQTNKLVFGVWLSSELSSVGPPPHTKELSQLGLLIVYIPSWGSRGWSQDPLLNIQLLPTKLLSATLPWSQVASRSDKKTWPGKTKGEAPSMQLQARSSPMWPLREENWHPCEWPFTHALWSLWTRWFPSANSGRILSQFVTGTLGARADPVYIFPRKGILVTYIILAFIFYMRDKLDCWHLGMNGSWQWHRTLKLFF